MAPEELLKVAVVPYAPISQVVGQAPSVMLVLATTFPSVPVTSFQAIATAVEERAAISTSVTEPVSKSSSLSSMVTVVPETEPIIAVPSLVSAVS